MESFWIIPDFSDCERKNIYRVWKIIFRNLWTITNLTLIPFFLHIKFRVNINRSTIANIDYHVNDRRAEQRDAISRFLSRNSKLDDIQMNAEISRLTESPFSFSHVNVKKISRHFWEIEIARKRQRMINIGNFE